MVPGAIYRMIGTAHLNKVTPQFCEQREAHMHRPRHMWPCVLHLQAIEGAKADAAAAKAG